MFVNVVHIKLRIIKNIQNQSFKILYHKIYFRFLDCSVLEGTFFQDICIYTTFKGQIHHTLKATAVSPICNVFVFLPLFRKQPNKKF